MKNQSKKKGIILVIALAFILVAFAGCGDGNDSTPTQGNNAQANNPVATNPPTNNQQENNSTATLPPTDNAPTETPAPTTEPEEVHPPERRGLDRNEQGHLDALIRHVERLCQEHECSDEEIEEHAEMVRELWLSTLLDERRSLRIANDRAENLARELHDN